MNRIQTEIPPEMVEALNAMSDEQIDLFNDYVERLQRPLRMKAVMDSLQHGGVAADTCEVGRVMFTGAGLMASILGNKEVSAGLAIIVETADSRPLIVVAHNKLMRHEGRIVMATDCPDPKDVVLEMQDPNLGSVDSSQARDMLAAMGIKTEGEDETPPTKH